MREVMPEPRSIKAIPTPKHHRCLSSHQERIILLVDPLIADMTLSSVFTVLAGHFGPSKFPGFIHIKT